MNRGFGMMMAFLAGLAVFCMGSTVMGKERGDYVWENERYALLEDAFEERTVRILEARGYPDSGVSITWTRDRDGKRSYQMKIHHRRIRALGTGERDCLTRALLCEDFCGEVEELHIIYDE